MVALVLIAAAAGLVVIGRERAGPYILVLLSVLGMIGVFSLFAVAAGILRVAVEDSNPLLQSLFDGAVDGIVVTDANGRVMYANAAYRALVNAVDPNDIRPVERAFIGDPNVSEAVYRLLRAAREGRRLQEEVRVAGPRNEPAKWIRLRIRPLSEDAKSSRITVWTVADVTRERERQENVFQELQQAIDYLDHAPVGFFSAETAGAISYTNATLATWLGYDLADVGHGGLKVTDIVAGQGASLFTGVSGMPGEVKTEMFDLDLKTRSGKTLPARLYHKVAFAADGTPGASRTIVLNRTEGTEAGRLAEVRFVRFFQNTPLAIATVDRLGHVVATNGLFERTFQALLAGSDTREARSILKAVNERDREALDQLIVRGARGESDVTPLELTLAGKGERWARFYVTPFEKESSGQEAAIVYALETTEQRNLERQFAQSEKMKTVGQLAGGVAHDFNNVLSAIMMATDFLLNAHKPTDPAFQDIMQIKQNANRAASLVRHLLAFSRRQTLRPQVLDLGEALSDLSMLLRRVIGENVTLDVVHGRDLWPVKTDLSQLEHVIVNLAVNARDAMPNGGKLTVRTSNITAVDSKRLDYKGLPAAEYVLVEVEDCGTGIPQDIIEQIFEPFFTTKEIGKGTGLGLSTVYGFIKQTGGYIYVDSEVGKGTTFRIYLPRHVATETETTAQPKAEIAAPLVPAKPVDDTGHGTILLVEDEEGLRGLNARGLTSRGYNVLEAGNGVEAIEVLEERDGQIDLVVSDVVMPEMDGPTLFKELRKRNPDLKIIFVSGYAEEAFSKSLPEGGQFAFLAKPFTLKQLVATVKETIEGEAQARSA
ncbi:MAG TPA: response regulator [Xanthobacteraceae bacterium]|nr:response regulator [Xanthobacteraceae bacterium]